MAERVKRRVAAARLAVAFVAAGTIAGAAWAQAGPPPPTAQSSAVDVFLKANTVKSENIVNGSLFFKDFHKGEVPSLEQFQKLQLTTERFKKVADRRFAEGSELTTVKGEIDSIKGELGTYVKSADADARYLKVSDPVVRGDGSVFSASKLITLVGKRVPVLEVPNLVTIEAENGKPTLFYVVNQTGGALTHTGCGGGGGGSIGASPPGVLQPGKFFHCPAGGEPTIVQLFGQGGNPIVITLTVSAIPTGQGADAQYAVQILVGT
jgi:hypothetical protein